MYSRSINVGLLAVLVTGLSAQTKAVLNDWKESLPDAVISSGSATNLVYNNGHGYAAGLTPMLVVYGGTGNWAAINTHFWAHQILDIGTTDTTMDVDLPDGCVPGLIYAAPEYMNISGRVNNILQISQRGVSGSPVTTHGAGSWVECNRQQPNEGWTATVINANTLQIPLDSHTFGPLTGLIKVKRFAGDDWFVRPVAGETGTQYDDQNNSAYILTAPACPNPTDVHQCLRAYWSEGTFSQKYPPGASDDSANCPITGFTVNNDQTATVNLGSGNLHCDSGYPFSNNRVAYIQNMTDARLNTVYQIVTAAPHQVTLQPVNSAVTPGSYTGNSPAFLAPNHVNPYVTFIARNGAGGYTYPAGYIQGMIKTGNFDPASNRIGMFITPSMTFAGGFGGSNQGPFYIGTYVKTGGTLDSVYMGSGGTHFYHYSPPMNVYAGRRMKFEFNMAPDHQVGNNGSAYWPNDPTYTGVWTYPPWSGAGGGYRLHYIQGLTSFYESWDEAPPKSGLQVTHGEMDVYRVDNEPEESVRTRTIVWAPSRLGSNDQGYEVSWTTPKNTPVTYEVRYSTTKSLKVGGFSTGTAGGTVNNPSVAGPTAYAGVIWKSPSMPEQPTIWVGLRPTVPVGGTSGAGGNQIWVITQPDLGMQVGDSVTVAGVGGNTAANKTSTPLVAVQPRQLWFAWDPSNYIIKSITSSGGSSTITTGLNGNFQAGQPIMIGGTWCPGYDCILTGATNLNGQQQITAGGANTFTIPVAAAGNYNAGEQATARPRGPLTNITAAGGSCTVTLAVNHNLVPGWKFYVVGTTDDTLGSQTNGNVWTVGAVPSGTSFTFNCPGVADGVYMNDNSAQYPMVVASWPGVAIAGTGNGTYTSGGTIVATDDTRNFAEISLDASATSSGGPPSPCDVNHDGVVNSLDVAQAVDASIGKRACDTDVDNDGKCDVVDVQRITNAANGGPCRTN